LTYPQFFLLVKNFAYDLQAIKNFYSYNNNGATTLNSLALPTFFAIAPLCSETNLTNNYNCLNYNINSISIENKSVSNIGLKVCSSIDNFTSPTDALAYTVRIKDDTFTINKNCFLAEEISMSGKNTLQSQSRGNTTSNILDSLTSLGISNQFQTEALLLAQFSDNVSDPDYNTEYTIQIKGSKLCKFVILSRPIFMKIGMSGLYKINYTSNGIGNTINVYNSDESDGSLVLKIRRVCDPRIYPTNTMNVEKALQILDLESASDIDCKPSSIIDTSNTFLNNYVQNTPAEVVPTVPMKHYTMMLYYLTHSQYIENANNSLTSCISIIFSELDFVATENVIFSFSSSTISTIYENGTLVIKLNNFGVTSEEYRITNPDMASVSFMCTWSDNRMNLAFFYKKNDTTHLNFKSIETISNCSFIKAAFYQACVFYECSILGRCNTFVSMYDIAISRNLI
jgi:hypothetical protein